MKYPIFTCVLLLCFCSSVLLSAQGASSSGKQDTIQLPELIVSSTKESARLSLLPASVSVLSQALVERQHILSIKEFSALSSNVYIPDYGSSLTSAVYVRGIGARAGAAAVAFYVDDGVGITFAITVTIRFIVVVFPALSDTEYDISYIPATEVFGAPETFTFGVKSPSVSSHAS